MEILSGQPAQWPFRLKNKGKYITGFLFGLSKGQFHDGFASPTSEQNFAHGYQLVHGVNSP
jgi:hypothetical protein